ncbi:MAG: D-aminoacyl-tRNA deacylase [Patescibacteria group bacterium]|nr:MAG: D-aminoacyl-tRNA deacylase [Patescibacteria group bacterium]
MRLVIQRVKKARVTVEGKVAGEVGKGLLVLLGVGREDQEEDAGALAGKLAALRIMADEEGKMNRSIKDVGGEVLVVSQFTLYADTNRGRRPSFVKAASPKMAEDLYKRFVRELRGEGIKVETGKFGHYMEIEAVADGPVTIILDGLADKKTDPRP